MLKQYFENIEWYDYLIYLVFNVIFSYLLFRIGEVFLSMNKKTLWILVGIFQLYFLLVIGDSFFNYLPYLPDTELYSYMISSGQYPQSSSENILVIYYISLFIGTVCLQDPVIFVFFCVFLYLIAVMLFLRGWKRFNPAFTVRAEQTAALLFLCWPSPLVYMTAPLRESFILFGFALFFNGFTQFIQTQKWRSLIIGTIIICAIRLQFIVFVFPVLGALAVYKLHIHKAIKVSILLATLAIAFLAVRYILVEHPVTPETMAQLRNLNLNNAGPLGYGNVEWHSYTDMAKDYPFIIAQFLFSPLPIFVQHDPISTFIPFLDCLFMIGLMIVIFAKFRYMLKHYAPVLCLIVFYIILFGGYEYHITGAVRHRMPLEAIFILLAAPVISKWLFKKKDETTEHTSVNH